MTNPISPQHAALLQELDLARTAHESARRRLMDYERLNLAQPCQSRGCGAYAESGKGHCPDCLREITIGWVEDVNDRDYARERG